MSIELTVNKHATPVRGRERNSFRGMIIACLNVELGTIGQQGAVGKYKYRSNKAVFPSDPTTQLLWHTDCEHYASAPKWTYGPAWHTVHIWSVSKQSYNPTYMAHRLWTLYTSAPKWTYTTAWQSQISAYMQCSHVVLQTSVTHRLSGIQCSQMNL